MFGHFDKFYILKQAFSSKWGFWVFISDKNLIRLSQFFFLTKVMHPAWKRFFAQYSVNLATNPDFKIFVMNHFLLTRTIKSDYSILEFSVTNAQFWDLFKTVNSSSWEVPNQLHNWHILQYFFLTRSYTMPSQYLYFLAMNSLAWKEKNLNPRFLSGWIILWPECISV